MKHSVQRRFVLFLSIVLTIAATFPTSGVAAGITAKTPLISGGAQAEGLNLKPEYIGANPEKSDYYLPGPPSIESLVLGASFLGQDFDKNAALTGGFLFIPPDPIGAAGIDRVIAVTNVTIQAKTKAGALLWESDLASMFSSLSPCYLGTFTFDPKIVYDQYAGRFVVVTLERVFSGANPSAGNASRILVAVSKTSTPATATAADWWFCCIDSKELFSGAEFWADYPGFEVDEEAIYITNNMFAFPPIGGYAGSRLWIVDKGFGSGGLYDGGTCAVTKHDPYAATSGSGSVATTTMPAQVYGPAGAGPGIGTYLVSYSGLTNGFTEFLQVIRVNNPLGAVSFTHDFIPVGDIEASFIIADAPQLGSPETILTNDQRALDAVWRDGHLWMVSTINPDGTALPGLPDHTTAYWWKLDTSAVINSASPSGLLGVLDDGGVPGEELASPPFAGDIYTFFPSIAVNSAGDAKIGFSASGETIFAGAYVTGRKFTDPLGSMRPAGVVALGLGPYIRTFDSPPCSATPARNRWGDYSGISVDPTDDRLFWVFNEYAQTPGTPTTGGCNGRPAFEDGRWGTAWAECAFPCLSLDCDTDLVVGNGFGAGAVFQREMCFTNCGALTTSFDFSISDGMGWCTASAGTVVLAPGATHCVTVSCTVPGATPGGTVNTITLAVEPTGCPADADTCGTIITVDDLVAVELESFDAISEAGGVQLNWKLGAGWQNELLAVGVQRSEHRQGPYEELEASLTLATQMSFRDNTVEPGRDYWYRLVTITAEGYTASSPVQITSGDLRLRTELFQPVIAADAVQLRFSLATAGQANLEIYDVRGRLVRTIENTYLGAGVFLRNWNRQDASGIKMSRGVYFVHLTADRQRLSTKVVLLGG